MVTTALACEDEPQSFAGAPRESAGVPPPSRDVPLMLSDSFARPVLAMAFLAGIFAHLYTELVLDNGVPARVDGDPSPGRGDPSQLDNGSGAPDNRPGSERIQGQGGGSVRCALLILAPLWLLRRFPYSKRNRLPLDLAVSCSSGYSEHEYADMGSFAGKRPLVHRRFIWQR
jgi:hypothetical protein